MSALPIVLTLSWPVSTNRYWTSVADPKLITELFKAMRAAMYGNPHLAREFIEQHGDKTPRGRALTFLTKEAEAYKEEVAWKARAAGIRQPLAGPIEVEYRLYPHLPKDWVKRAKADPLWWDLTVQSLDIDNARKCVNDALNGIAWTDDKMIRHDPGWIMVPDGEARIVLTIKPYERPHPQDQLFERTPVYVPHETRVEKPKRVKREDAPAVAEVPADKQPF